MFACLQMLIYLYEISDLSKQFNTKKKKLDKYNKRICVFFTDYFSFCVVFGHVVCLTVLRSERITSSFLVFCE